VPDVVSQLTATWLESLPSDAIAERGLLDVGFGSGWVVHELRRLYPTAPYVGIDVTEQFVVQARAKFARDPRAVFDRGDIERSASAGRMYPRSAAVIAALSLCEMPQLRPALRNIAHLVDTGGQFLAITINPWAHILRSGGSAESVVASLAAYRMSSEAFYVSKPISIGDERSPMEYVTILYSLIDLLRESRPWFDVVEVGGLGLRGAASASDPGFDYLILRRTTVPADSGA